MTLKNFMSLILVVAFSSGNYHIRAQDLGLDYDTELQTNFRGDYKWVNLLRLNGSVNVSKNVKFEAATISVARTNDESLIDDLQGYSNIEEANLSLGIAMLGVEYTNRRSIFFLGIRNVNEDYFTSPVTSLFVNSSAGIFPTISGNYDIANYPLSSWCFHYKASWDNLLAQTSIYEGLSHRRIAGHDNVFSLDPSQNGLFSITSLEYDNNGNNYSVGCAVYYGVHNRDEILSEAETPTSEASSQTSKSVSVAPWLNVEQRVNDACSLMLQAAASTAKTNCRYYFGLGASYKLDKVKFGLMADYARYYTCDEIACELTCHIPLTPIMSLQPTVELIRTDSKLNSIGILRLSISI